MKINGIKITGNKFAYDGCHKIYIIEDENDLEMAKDCGYDIYDMEDLESCYINSCELKFIRNWKLSNQYVKQFEEAEFEYSNKSK